MLANLDLILIIAYFIVVLFIGWRASRKEDNKGFLVGNRQIGTTSLNATVSASLTGGAAIAAYIALLYLWGFSAFWIFIGACIGLLVFIPFAAKIKKEGCLIYFVLQFSVLSFYLSHLSGLLYSDFHHISPEVFLIPVITLYG